MTVGVYRLKWRDDVVVEISHISGAKASLPRHTVITRDFELRDNHLDLSAACVDKSTCHVLAELFEKPYGPWDHALTK